MFKDVSRGPTHWTNMHVQHSLCSEEEYKVEKTEEVGFHEMPPYGLHDFRSCSTGLHWDVFQRC